MALSDLELLDLVNEASELRTGPPGPAGNGIVKIEQNEPGSFTIYTADGAFKRITLPPGTKGETGDVGPAGADGAQGATGATGRPGKDGLDGQPGPSGADGVWPTVGAITDDGELLIGLSDGSRLNCGVVIGPAGPAGPTGLVGPAGAAGADGTQTLSGPNPPSDDDGQEGDHWIAYAVPEMPLYKRDGGGWKRIADLRQLQNPRVVGSPVASGSGSGGGGAAQTTATLPLASPSRNTAKSLPDSSGLKSQADFNNWCYGALESLAAGVSPEVNLSDYTTKEETDALALRVVSIENDYTTTDEYNGLNTRIKQNSDDIKALQAAETPDLNAYATKSELSTATQALPYRLETDKVLRSDDLPTKQSVDGGETRHAGGEIQLVDNLGFFHNVRFTGLHGIKTESDQQGILVNAKELSDKIRALEETVEILTSLVPPADIGNVTITGGNTVENGSVWLAQNETGIFVASNDGTTQHGLRYQWSIERGNARISGPSTMSTVTLICQDPPPNTVVLKCLVSHPATEDIKQADVSILVTEA